MLDGRNPAQRFKLLHFLNQGIDEFLSLPDEHRVEVFQMAPGIFEGDSTLLLGRGFRIIRCSSAQPLLLRWIHRSELLLVFPLHDRPLYCQGRRWTRDQQLAVLAADQIVMSTPECNDMLIVMLSLDLLRKHYGPGDTERFLQCALALQKGLATTSGRGQYAVRLSGQIKALCNRPWQETDDEHGALLEQLVASLYGYITTIADMGSPTVQCNHERIVQLVLARLLVDPAADLGLDDLCQSAYCSRRTLASAFEDVCGLPPMKFVRKVRLNALRRELLRSRRPEELSIVTAGFGYSNAGRLNKEYRELFGERPMETLRQRRKSCSFPALLSDSIQFQ